MAVLELNPIPTDAAEPAAAAPAVVAAPTAPPLGAAVLDIVRTAVTSEKTDAALLTRLYLKLRNGKKDIDEQAKARTRPITEGLEMIEAKFLDMMLSTGVDSLKNESGTPYKTEAVSITVADNSVFVDYVLGRALQGLPLKDEARDAIKNAIVESGQLALIEARASKSAVEEYLKEMKELPPGLNRRVEAKVNVRSA